MTKLKSNLIATLGEIRQVRGTNIWTFIMYGLLFDMVNNLWRPFAAVFLERIGGTEFEIALLSSLPGLVGAIVLLPGAMLFRRITNQKRATAAFILISRAMLLAIALVPALPPAIRPLLFVILVAIMNCPDALSQTSLQNFLGVVFSGQMRGTAIAMRTKFGQAVVPIVTISAGLVITFVPNNEAQRMLLYQVFFVGAFLLGIVEVLVFNRLKVPEYMQEVQANAPKAPPIRFGKILREKKFWHFVAPTIIFSFTWQAGWPLNNIYQIMVLEASEMWFAIFALTSGTAALLAGGFWQKMMRNHGNNRVFLIAASLVTMNMFIFPIIPNVQVMAVFSAFTGASSIGLSMYLLNGVLEAAPDENRMTYIACFNTINNISLFLAPLLAGLMLQRIGLINAMLVVGVMRIASTSTAAIWVWRVKKQFTTEDM